MTEATKASAEQGRKAWATPELQAIEIEQTQGTGPVIGEDPDTGLPINLS